MIDDIIVDMQSPTPLDLYRYSSSGTVDIRISKNSSRYSLHIDDSSLDNPIVLTNMSKSMLQTWELIEMLRQKAFQEHKVVNVYDKDSRTSFKRVTLATTLNRIEKAEALERQAKTMANSRRRFGVTPTKRTRGRLVDPKLIRPIQREDRTW